MIDLGYEVNSQCTSLRSFSSTAGRPFIAPSDVAGHHPKAGPAASHAGEQPPAGAESSTCRNVAREAESEMAWEQMHACIRYLALASQGSSLAKAPHPQDHPVHPMRSPLSSERLPLSRNAGSQRKF